MITKWKTLDFSDIPSSRDVESYFMYQKNPVAGARLHFDRQMKKEKRLCNEGFFRDILYRQINDALDLYYITCTCLPSMRQTVNIDPSGLTAKFYTLHVCLGITIGNICNAKCNWKAGGAGLCSHVRALLYKLVKTKESCTSNECTWDRPRPLQEYAI